MSTQDNSTAPSDSFDVHDAYDAAVLWHTFLECKNCGKLHEFPENPDGASIAESLPSYHISGQRAKVQGWYVADSGRLGQAEWTILCPTCTTKRGLSLSDSAVHTPSSPVVLAFYQATTGRQP